MIKKRSKLLLRRDFIQRLLFSGAFFAGPVVFGKQIFSEKNDPSIRHFHVSLQPEAWLENPDLISILKTAGVTDIWMASFLQGEWYHRPKELRRYADFLKMKGFNPHALSVPLGHPGNALDPDDLTYSKKKLQWENACTYTGELFSGTSIHPPVVKENIDAVNQLAAEGFDALFLDDDFRLARFPGHIGGCFCDDCKNEFLNKYGYGQADWEFLLDSIAKRNPSKILFSWIHSICDKEFEMFRLLQNAVPRMDIGIMVMYLGAEKAGIALDKYIDVPFRVGELMFDDKSFGRIKGKTDELFSSLFHRRFVKPALAYSESTSYPADALSAGNMAAKLSVSLLSDVRNTMFMSGLKPFPADHWNVLGPAMKKSAELHKKIAGFKPKGPFKHFWGWDSRMVGTDKPFSLFLASGIPFEVEDEFTKEGWIFLSDEDARSVVEGRILAKNKNLMVRREAYLKNDDFIQINETLDDIFAFKKRIIPDLKNIPYVEGNIPVVFSWYPEAGKALLWNVNEVKHLFQIRFNGKPVRRVSIEGLDVALVSI